MVITYNGMPAAELGDVRWQKSWHSNPNGECVELAALPTGEIAMRNSRFPSGPVLLYTQAEITAFLAGAKDGEFDHLLNARTSLPASNTSNGRYQAAREQLISKRDPSDLREYRNISNAVESSRNPLLQGADHMGDWSTPRQD